MDNEKKYLLNELIFIYILCFSILAIFTYTVNSIISPLILFITLIIALLPIRKLKAAKVFFNVALFLFLIWLIDSLSNILAPFIIAFIIAYLSDPLVKKLEKIKIPRTAGIFIILLFVIGFLGILLAFIIPPFLYQISSLINSIPQFANSIKIWITTDLINFLQNIGIPKENVESILNTSILPKLESSLNILFNTIFSIFTRLSSILSHLINLVIIPILTFYTIKDFEYIKSQMRYVIPKSHKENVDDVIKKFDNILGNYIRGAIIIAFINGSIITLFLSLFGVQYSLVLGIISGLMTLIPYFGVFIAFGTGMIVSLLSGLTGFSLLLIPLLYFGENLIETSILYPKIVGTKVGLHPLILILSISVFSYFLGLIGMLIAVPVTSVILLLLKENVFNENETLNSEVV